MLTEVRKRERDWSLRWITPDLDVDWRERSSLTRSSLDSEVAVMEEETAIKRKRNGSFGERGIMAMASRKRFLF